MKDTTMMKEMIVILNDMIEADKNALRRKGLQMALRLAEGILEEYDGKEDYEEEG